MEKILDSTKGVGLAAPQIGVSKRVFIFKTPSSSGTLVNPVLTEFQDLYTTTEACLSIPGIGFMLPRYNSLILKGYDPSGKPVTIPASDLLAQIFQHEVNHLNGLTLDKIATKIDKTKKL